ncbi:MAG: NAD(P)H-hydrate dehydratase [Patescibacteria group bacterium]
MEDFDKNDLKKLYIPASDSHKGQNGKVLIIAGSRLFHAASLWPLKVASRIVDMVYYCSVPQNNEVVAKAKEEFRDGIIVPRDKVDDYINDADCILIGPGMPRKDGEEVGDDDTKELTEKLLQKYKDKKWVVDGGSLQVMDLDFIPTNSILTPHPKEFEMLFQEKPTTENVGKMAKKYNCVVLVKGEKDIVCSPFDSPSASSGQRAQGETCIQVSGGNAGMTKGGTGDVLAGLVASLYCKNDAFLSAKCASYINKKAGESLAKRVGLYFNSSDLADEIPKAMKELTP